MAKIWKTVRVFISSTFRDMHAERDHLIKVVFPELREHLEKHRIHMVDIDLRWGVTKEQADNDMVLDLCLEQIDRCRPFFVGILGQRYGCIPDKMPDPAVKKYGWVQGMTGKSITELEILHGVLNNPGMKEHAIFLFRKDDYLKNIPKKIQKDVYLDEHPEKLKAIKKEISDYCRKYNAPLHEYLSKWDGDALNPEDRTKGRIVDLDEFGEWIKEELWNAIAREYPEILEPPPPPAKLGTEDWLEEEQDYHERFIESRLQVYIGREKIHNQLTDYLEGNSTQPLLLVGGSGTGKSAILSKLWEDWKNKHSGDFILPHFVGASPSSTNLRMILKRFCLALRKQFNLTETVAHEGREPEVIPKPIPEEAEKLSPTFREFLESIPENENVVLIIDALNQLDETYRAQEMNWLPSKLPTNVKIIVSCIEEPDTEQAALMALRKRSTPEIKVEPLSNEERFEIVSQVPTISAKILDPKQIGLLLGNPATKNPLYLIVALEELRGFGSFEKLNEKIESFPQVEGEEGLNALFTQVVERLETELNKNMAQSILACIASSRNGLSERELSGILKSIGVGKKDEQQRWGEMQVMLRQLRPYLLRRGEYVDFYHRNLFKAVRQKYLSFEENQRQVHQNLSVYFLNLGLKSERMLSETPHHLCKATMWNDLEKILTDLYFVEAKCKAGMTYDLITDYNIALNALPEAQEEKQKEQKHEERVKKYIKDLIAYAKGEIKHLNIIPSVEPWREEEIRKDTERIINNPTRLDRITVFSQFVKSESHRLSKFCSVPGFFLQQARNSADSGPVANAAQNIIKTGAYDCLILHTLGYRPHYNPHPALLRSLDADPDEISSVSITPDGKRAISCGYHFGADNFLRVWDLESGECVKFLHEYPWKHADCVSVTPDAKRAVSGSSDKTLRVWDLETEKCIRTLVGHNDKIRGVIITPDGKRAVSGSNDKTLRVWDLESGKCLKILEGHTYFVNCVSITPDAKLAVSGSGKTLRVWDLEHAKCLKILEGHGDTVNCVSITPDAKLVVSGSLDKTLRVCDVASWKCIRILKGHIGTVQCVSITPDGKIAVSGGGNLFTISAKGTFKTEDNTLRVWDLESGKCSRTIVGHIQEINSVSMTPDGKIAVSGSKDRTLRVWDIQSGDWLRPLYKLLAGGVWNVIVTPDGKKAIGAGGDRFPRIWDLEWGKLLTVLKGHATVVPSMSVAPNGKEAFSGGADGDLRMWDLESGKCLRALEHHPGEVKSINITPDGKRIISSVSFNETNDNMLRVWDLETGKCLKKLKGHTCPVTNMIITPDGKYAVSSQSFISHKGRIRVGRTKEGSIGIGYTEGKAFVGFKEKAPRVWDLESGRCLKRLQGHTHSVECLDITPDGKIAVSGSRDRTLRVWDLMNGECIETLEGHSGPVDSVSITPDGKRVVSGSGDKTVRVWDLRSRKCLKILEGHTESVNSVSITPDGKIIVSTIKSRLLNSDNTIRIWDIESGQCFAVYQPKEGLSSTSKIRSNGHFVCGTITGDIIQLRLHNSFMASPIVTACRIWRYGDMGKNGQWDNEIKVVCSWCGKRFSISDKIVDIINSITRDANLFPNQSPCLELPSEAWDEPRLLSECPLCHKALKLNPFIVDNSKKKSSWKFW